MTSIAFLDKPNILVFKIKDDSVVAYNTLLDYMNKVIGASQPRNVCALAVDLARANGMSMSELFKIYQR